MDRYQDLINRHRQFYAEREQLRANNSAPNLFSLLTLEIEELETAMKDYAFYFGNTEPSQRDWRTAARLEHEVKSELADVGWFLVALFEHYGIDMWEAMSAKNERNQKKYGIMPMNDMSVSYDEARRKSIEIYNATGGDKAHYKPY